MGQMADATEPGIPMWPGHPDLIGPPPRFPGGSCPDCAARKRAKRPWCYLGADQLDRLDHASLIVAQALDVPYLVGSVLERPDYRDVDVRVVLDDDEYARLFPGPGTRRTDPFWSLFCASVTEYLTRLTGLPIDFQVQDRTHGNTFSGKRHPLGIYPVAPVDNDDA